MKILYITPEFSGSKSFFLHKGDWTGMPGQKYFFETMLDENHQIFVIAEMENEGDGGWKNNNITVKYFSKIEINRILRILQKLAPPLGFYLYYLIIFLRFSKDVRDFDPDIIYGCWTFGAGLGRIIKQLFHKPLLVRMFGTGLARYLNDWQNIKKSMAPDVYFYRTLPFKVRSDALIITADGTSGEKIAQLLGYPSERIFKLLNGVNFKRKENFDHQRIKNKWNIPTSSFVFTYTGRLEGWKRIDRVLFVFKEIQKLDPNVILVFGGYGADEALIRQFTAENNLSNHILLTGPLPHNQVQEILSISDIHLSLNDLTNLTNTTIEALACGCCVVALNNGETMDLIKDGENGFLFDENDQRISMKIFNLMKDNELRKHISSNALKTIKQKFVPWKQRIKTEELLMTKLISQNCIKDQ